MSEIDRLYDHLRDCVDSDNYTVTTSDGVEFNIFEWAFGVAVNAKKEHDALVGLATKHATRADELYEVLKDIHDEAVDYQNRTGKKVTWVESVSPLLEKPTISNSNDD